MPKKYRDEKGRFISKAAREEQQAAYKASPEGAGAQIEGASMGEYESQSFISPQAASQFIFDLPPNAVFFIVAHGRYRYPTFGADTKVGWLNVLGLTHVDSLDDARIAELQRNLSVFRTVDRVDIYWTER